MSFPSYERYKDSGQEWLGEVPEHWATTKVKWVADFFTGWTPPTGDDSGYLGDNLWANISDLGPRVLTDTAKTISDTAISRSRMKLSSAGSLLFSFKLSIGQVSFAGADMYTNEAIATFPPTDRVDLRYAYYAWPLYIVRNAAENIYGAKLLNQELIRAAPLALPSLLEQSTIATFLDRETAKIDAFVDEQKRLIELLKEKRQAVISHAVTKGLEPNVPMKDSGVDWLGEVPEHWALPKLKYIAKFAGGGTPSRDNPAYWGGSIPWVSPKDMKWEFIDSAEEAITDDGVASSATSIRPVGQVLLVVRSGILKHTIPTAINRVPVALNQDMKAISFEADYCLSDFFRRWVQGLNDQLLLVWGKQGATVESLEHDYMADTVLPLPPPPEQQAIASFLNREIFKIDQLVSEAETTIALLQERLSALISAAVTGKVDVRGLVADETEAA